ncbi:hypothetical protein GCM10007418_32820 [Halopseudomonas salina]|uniref:Uncharacterized protein n=1 Tax=Halopseudomonas salina TaxID=1323744 RepID=A0ABQ1Q396_9GAMM|nr:hypothetical protein GCM10007418_32820 [Halopseudomonas salina]
MFVVATIAPEGPADGFGYRWADAVAGRYMLTSDSPMIKPAKYKPASQTGVAPVRSIWMPCN